MIELRCRPAGDTALLRLSGAQRLQVPCWISLPTVGSENEVNLKKPGLTLPSAPIGVDDEPQVRRGRTSATAGLIVELFAVVRPARLSTGLPLDWQRREGRG